ncbi:glycosyltransferase 87 family protein [Actinosynnema mirum]|uniref:glycosyltransferase 87 family protein n=1 Tax=Actinosynnema mirum TaxID=40567 RepID=UPI00030A80DB|nr:glycosyltransferase 87 family protein [Actinosynnema mirum]
MAVVERPDKRLLGVWAVAAVALLVIVHQRSSEGLLDLRVYRTGGEAWLRDLRLYADDFPKPLDGPPFPFTYPPLAAAIFSLFALVPFPAAVLVWTTLGLVLLLVVCVLSAWHLYGDARRALLVGVIVSIGALVLEPVWATFDFGQINLVIMGLAALDCLLPRTRWPRGLLIGFAAAIKLTPAVFVLFFLARGRWKPVLTAVASFVGFGLVGAVVAFEDTKQYWFHTLLDPARIGELGYAGNQSLRGLVNRLGLTGAAESVAWLLLSLGVAALAWVAVRRAREDVSALLAVSIAALLASPVSWTHHWVWVVPGLVLLVGQRSVAGWVTLVLVADLFVWAPLWLLPHDKGVEVGWNAWQQLVGNSYVLVAVAALVYLAVRKPAPVTRLEPDVAPVATDR